MASIPVSASLEELEDFLRSGIDELSSPSVAYGIGRGSETLLLGAKGFSDKDNNVVATSSTPYSLASVTKPMATTAIAILADRGLIDLDAPINDYLGSSKIRAMVGDASAATIRTVACHTAGLPLHYQFFYEDEPFSPPEMDETIFRYGKLYWPPKERYQYSNIGFGILDYVVEKVSGKPFAAFMSKEVFEPLGMANASIGAGSSAAIAYGADGIGYPRYEFDHPGASAAFASVEDLLKFGRSHLGFGTQILSPSARVEMQRENVQIGDTWGYALGWATNQDLHGLQTVGHAGGMSGVNTVLLMVPSLELVIVILVNGQSALPFRGADNALGALLPDFRARLEAERSKPESVAEKLGVPSEFWRCWEGSIDTFTGSQRLVVTILGETEGTANLDGLKYPLDEMQFKDGRIQGKFAGQLTNPDAARRAHELHLDLKPRDGRLSGAAVAISTFEGEGGGAPGNRRGNAQSFWTELV